MRILYKCKFCEKEIPCEEDETEEMSEICAKHHKWEYDSVKPRKCAKDECFIQIQGTKGLPKFCPEHNELNIFNPCTL